MISPGRWRAIAVIFGCALVMIMNTGAYRYYYAAHLEGAPCGTQLPGIRQTLSLYRYVRAPRFKSAMLHNSGSMGS